MQQVRYVRAHPAEKKVQDVVKLPTVWLQGDAGIVRKIPLLHV
jgi:hypothetical protein